MGIPALLIVDVQVRPFIWKDYGGKELYKGEDLLATLGSLIDGARTAGVPVLYTQHTEDVETHMLPGSPLWEVHPLIAPMEKDIRISKRYADPFHQTKLEEQLRRLDVNTLVVAGIQTEYCVDTTCRSASRLGFRTILVEDGHSTFDTEVVTAEQIIRHHNFVLGGPFAEVIPAGKVHF